MKNSLISRRTTSFLISFSLVFGSMLSGVGPFENIVEKAWADSGQGNAVKVYGFTFYNERQYVPWEMVEPAVKSVGGTAGFDTIDVCTNGRHLRYGEFSGAGGGIGGAMAGSSFVVQGDTQFTCSNYFYSNQYVGNGHATLWVPENPKVTSRVLEANVCKLDTYEYPSPYGHEYRFNPKGSEYLFSMMTPVLQSGDVFVQKAYYNIVETGECYISRPPTPGSMWLLHHYYENGLSYPLLFMYYDNENDAKNAVYSEPVPLRGANLLCYIDTLADGKGNIGKFTEKPGCDFYNAASVYFGEVYDNTSYPYRNREAYIINVYPPNNPKKFTPENPQDITGQLIRLHGIISRETIILPDMTMPYLDVDFYSISYNGISVNRIKREREDTYYAEDELPHQLPSELEIDGESVYVDNYEVIGLPTAEDPTLSLKVNETRVAHNDSHVTKYEKIDDTYHHKVCTYNGCEYEEAREKHTFGDWIIDTPATENSKGRRHKTCTVEGCGYSTPVEEFDFVNGSEIDLSSVFEKVDSEVGNGEPVYINSDSELKMTSAFLSNMRETIDAYNKANKKSYSPIENVVLALYEDENQLSRSGYQSATGQRGMYTGRRQSGYSADCYYARTYENNDDSYYGHSKIVLSKKIPLNDSINAYYRYLGAIVGNNKVDEVKSWYENAKTKQWKVVYGNWDSDAYYFCAVLTDIPKSAPGEEEEIPPHEHNIEATLSGNDLSRHWVYCKKDDRAAENDPSSCTFKPYFEDHTFGEWEAGTTANGHAGKHFRKCIQCGYEEEGEHVAVSENGVDVYFSLTESSVDKHFKSCCICGEKMEEENCSYGDWETVTPATHKAKGIQIKTCSVCDHIKDDVNRIPELEHTWSDSWSSDDECHWHRCTAEECATDSSIFDEKIAHDFTEYNQLADDSKKDTYHSATCGDCGRSVEEAHTWVKDEARSTTPTCTDAGGDVYTCVCGAEKTDEIAALGHDFQAEWSSDDTDHWHECSRANGDEDHEKSSKAAHEYEQKADANDHWQECKICGHRKDVEAHDVDPDEEWVSGNEVSHYHTCTVCGGHADEGEHVYGDWEVTDEATEDENGSRSRRCTVCGYIQTEVIAKKEKAPEEKPEEKPEETLEEKKASNEPVPPPSNTITKDTANVVLVAKNAYSVTGGLKPETTGKNSSPYTVGNPKILKIDKNGNIKVKNAGTTTISFTTADGETHTVTVTVEKPKKQNKTINDPNVKEIDANSLLSGVTYSVPDSITSSKPGVATVGTDGKIHINGKGKAKIKYQFGKYKVASTLNVKVDPAPSGQKPENEKVNVSEFKSTEEKNQNTNNDQVETELDTPEEREDLLLGITRRIKGFFMGLGKKKK